MPAVRFDHPLAPALVGVLCAGVVLSIHIARAGGDIGALVGAARPWADRATLAPNVPIVAAGYDGQFYYRLTLDPFSDRLTDHGITFDRPAYRQQRILYPLLAWAVSGGGDAGRVPLALVLVNVAGIFAIGWLGGSMARAAGRHALWGSLFTAYPGLVLTLTNDLTEIVAAALLLTALWLLRSERTLPAALALALSALARETTVLLAAAVGLARLSAAPTEARRWLPFALPAVIVILWQVALAVRWGSTTFGEGAESFDPPLLGLLAAAWLNGDRLRGVDGAVWGVAVAFVLALVVLGARALAGSPRHERAAWYVYASLLLVLEANIWANAAVLRIATELGMLTALLALGAAARARWALLGLEVTLVAILAVSA